MADSKIRPISESQAVRRLVASVRLSALTDTTNAPKTQRKDITGWVADHPGNRIVGWTEDLDVSGGIPIAEREGIGVWLQPERLGDWDGIIGHRLDRLFRDQLDYLLFVRDLGEEYGKFVIDAEDGIDSSTDAGRRILNSRSEVGQYERERIARNRARAAREIREEGRWNGGAVPFGYRKVEIRDEDTGKRTGWTLEIHEPYAVEVRDWVDRILAGASVNSIVQRINGRVPTSRDAQRILSGQRSQGSLWQVSSLLAYLRSPVLKGYVLYHPMLARQTGKKRRYSAAPEVVRGADGLPLRRPAILDDETWDDLQQVLGKIGEGRASHHYGAQTLLLGVAFCDECSSKLYRAGNPDRRVRYYYECSGRRYRGCKAGRIPEDELDEIILVAMENPAIKDSSVKEIRRVQTNERERRLHEVGQAITDLTEARYMRGIERPDYDDVLAGLQQEHARLRTLPPEPSQEREVETGVTTGQLWARLDKPGRRAFLLGSGLRLYVRRDDDNSLHIRVEIVERSRYARLPLPELLKAG